MRLLFPAVAISLTAIPLILLSSCGGSPGGELRRSPAASSTAPVAVTAAPVSRQEWPTVYEATGTVRARTTAAIASKVMGYVQQVSAQVGDHVAEGQVLVTLEVRDLDAAVRSAETARAEVASAIPEADSAVAAAKANLDLAQATFHRMQDLAAKKSISDQEFDEASARLKAAQAGYDMARGRRAQLDSKMAEAGQAVRSATVMQEYARISAPFAGIVTAKSAEPGSLATAGAPLITIEHDGVYRLEASVDESRLSAVRPGQSVEVSIDAMDRRLNCRVSEIVPAMDAASRSALVKIDLPAVPQLRSGMFGRAFFPLGARTVVAVPAAAVIERGQLQSVFVVEDGSARARLLTTGQRTGDFVEVLSGLSAGERVVAPVPTGLQDGARLEVRQ